CPGCGKAFQVGDLNAGKAAKCKACGRQFQIPDKSSSENLAQSNQPPSAVKALSASESSGSGLHSGRQGDGHSPLPDKENQQRSRDNPKPKWSFKAMAPGD